MTPTWRRPLSNAIRGAIALLALAAFTPGSASASCGDYVHVLPPGAKASADIPMGVGGADHAQPKQVPCPCQGPQCSGAPAAPLTPPTAPAPTSPSPPEAVVDAEPARDPAGVAALSVEPHSPLPDLVRCIFHPPRG